MKTGIVKPEILAPVGGDEQLLAAVRCGADAVYFGLRNFNARRSADNFSDDVLAEKISYCHARSVKVYITVNTLVCDDELAEMKKCVDIAVHAGADALIVQDLAVSRYVKEKYPDVHLHASTQMVCHNSAGVMALTDYGFDRIVLARELSLEEIKSIREKTHAQLEVFVHGALCMSLSGACYMSSIIGGRSGNRGLCAQPCRLDWRFGCRDHVLSLKDMSHISHINELADAGVCSLKIEGRMKRAEYVAAAVTACRLAREGKAWDEETLKAVFSRSGFTDGYLTGKRDEKMFGYRTKEDVVAATEKIYARIRKSYEKETQSIPVRMRLIVKNGEASRLCVSDGTNEINVIGTIPQTAETKSIDEAYASRFLSKTGGTPFIADEICVDADGGLMLSAAALNELRRNALSELEKKRGAKPYAY